MGEKKVRIIDRGSNPSRRAMSDAETQVKRTDNKKLGMQVKRTDDEKLEYVNFLLIVNRMDLTMYWQHLGIWNGTVLIHSMSRSNSPGYCNFKVCFQESVSTGYHCITSCSAEELYEDRRFNSFSLFFFRQLLPVLKRRYNFSCFFKLIAHFIFL